jgi:GMP synthase (glutamine-hydrolysing)
MSLKILLLQARNEDDPMRVEERRSFADKTGLAIEQVVPHDLLNSPPTMSRIKRHDAVMVGGSGDYYISNRSLPHCTEQLEILAEVVEAGHPMFASCFGFHILVAALGGKIIHDPENMEVGTYRLTLTDEGQSDPLLGQLPKCFEAQLGRKDRASRLPATVVNLAFSDRNPFQCFRVPGRPIWATQFHPELDAKTNRDRFVRYRDGYSHHMSPEDQEATLKERFKESPHTEELLRAFLDLVFE